MDAIQDSLKRANYLLRKSAYAMWHRQQSKQLILRSQLGFTDKTFSRPKPCTGCLNYHGVAYGNSYDKRTVLICGIHPYGWQAGGNCPDWLGERVSICI